MFLAKLFPSWYVLTSYRCQLPNFTSWPIQNLQLPGLSQWLRPKRAHGIYGHCRRGQNKSGPLFERAAKGPMEDQSDEKEGILCKKSEYSNILHDLKE